MSGRRKAGALVLAALLGAAPAAPAFAAGANSAEFLRFGAGSPSMLSDASGSSVQGPTAVYWNPAGLAGMSYGETYLSHFELPLSVQYDFLGLGVPFRYGVAGFGLQLLNQASLPKIDKSGQDAGSFSANDWAATFAYARGWGETRAGLSLKAIRQTIDGTSGGTFAADFGVQRDFGRLSAGAALTNAGPGLKIGSESFPLPLTFRFGGTYKLLDSLTAAADFSTSDGRGERLHTGAKYRLWGPLAIGAGYTVGGGSEEGPSGLAAGLSIDYKPFTVDFAYRPFGELGTAVQIGLGLRFGKSRGTPPASSPAPSPAPVAESPPAPAGESPPAPAAPAPAPAPEAH